MFHRRENIARGVNENARGGGGPRPPPGYTPEVNTTVLFSSLWLWWNLIAPINTRLLRTMCKDFVLLLGKV